MERYSRQVFYYETDKMSIVHNANYLRIFEEARLFFMEQVGVPYTSIEDCGILIPVVDGYVRYHHTLKYGDEFCVDVKMTEFNGARMKFQYEVRRKGDEELIATGFTTHCFIDEVKRLPLSIKKRLPETYELMMKHTASGSV
ncbi:MAG: acyl-CoA thioesterase [Parasporobacterium sp.]|nr:acyl-CoA thioesterase [Parasporobacterium sp.]